MLKNLHKSVLKKEVIEILEPKANENFIDATINGGGHAIEILKRNGPKGKVLGIDWDKEIIENLKSKVKNSEFKKRLILVNGNFKNLKEIVKKNCATWMGKTSGIIFDLGFSSWHIEKSERGFSFKKDEILDMRYSQNTTLKAVDILNKWPEKEIERILREYGEEKFSRKIAKAIIEKRKKKPIIKTKELVEVIEKIISKKKGEIHPATRTFQALRIAVNEELENIKKALPQAIEVLKSGGKLVVISFHSLEDRIVKNFFNEKEKMELVKILTKKLLRPTFLEIKENPRARSAKLRAIEKI